MASNYTANYGLCQWEPGDSFMRTEFNQDNERVEAALHTLETGKASQEDMDHRFQTLDRTVDGKAVVAAGAYMGDSTGSRMISLPFTPRAVLVETKLGYRNGDGKIWGGLALLGQPAATGAGHTLVSISDGGFRVYTSGNAATNQSGNEYHYVAWG